MRNLKTSTWRRNPQLQSDTCLEIATFFLYTKSSPENQYILQFNWEIPAEVDKVNTTRLFTG